MRLRIKELREEFGLTQKELAQKIDNAQRNVSNWEAGVSEPDCDTIVRLADLFGVSTDELFGRDGGARGAATVSHGIESELLRMIMRMDAQKKAAVINLIKAFE